MLVDDTEVFALIRQRQEPQQLGAQGGHQDSYFPAHTTLSLAMGDADSLPVLQLSQARLQHPLSDSKTAFSCL